LVEFILTDYKECVVKLFLIKDLEEKTKPYFRYLNDSKIGK